MTDFNQYLNQLSPYELLVVYKYRFDELNKEKQGLLLGLMDKHHVTMEQYESLQKKELAANKNKAGVCCPRCKTKRVMDIETENRANNLGDIYVAWTFGLGRHLVNIYCCNLCKYVFKKWATPKELWQGIKTINQ